MNASSTTTVSTARQERSFVPLQAQFRSFSTLLDDEWVCSHIEQLLVMLQLPTGWHVEQCGILFILTSANQRINVCIQRGSLQSQSVLSYICPPLVSTDILLFGELYPDDLHATWLFQQLEASISELSTLFVPQEVEAILDSMPLMGEFAARETTQPLAQFALIWRDHFLEENVALLQAFEQAGIEPHWIYTLSKGDRTSKWQRIGAHFRSRGYQTDLFAHQDFDGEASEQAAVSNMLDRLEQFIVDARAAGKRIMLIDDGGLLMLRLGQKQHLIDLALELTIAGIRRLELLNSVDIPVYDVARSEFKISITYPEIGESCVKRIRELLAAEKFSGRSILIVGYGAAGASIAQIFRTLGGVVSVVDTNVMRLIEAAEKGFRTFRSVEAAIERVQPFLVVGCTGNVSFSQEDIERLPHNAYITAVATKDLTILNTIKENYHVAPIPHLGYQYTDAHGKRFTQLGDGRSVNLFESEAIPNRANDVFKTGIFVAALHLAQNYSQLAPGVHWEAVDAAIMQSGLLERYYDVYLHDRVVPAFE